MFKGITRKKWFPDDTKNSEREAAAWELEEKRRLELEPRETTPTGCSLLELATAYLDHVKARQSRATYSEKRSSFRFLGQTFGPDTLVKDITLAKAEQHLAAQAKKRSGNAANKDRKNLARAWVWAAKRIEGFPRINPFRDAERFAEEREPRYVPPEEDFWKVYQEAEGQDRVMLLTFLHTAARRGEVFRLRWDDLDFAERKIRLGTRKRKGGGMEYDWIPMTDELKTVLLQWWEDRPIKAANVFVCLESTPFCEQYRGQPFGKRLQFMRRLCDRAGVKRFGFHAIRHLTASTLYRAGYPSVVIQQILRHQRATTTDAYLRSLGLLLESSREALEGGLAASKGRVIELKNKRPRTGTSEAF